MKTLLFVAVAAFALACHSEPTFVITFSPQDGGASRDAAPAARAVARPAVDAALRVDAAPAAIPTSAKDVHECKRASDCITVAADCCDCTSGGRQIAIAKSKLAAYKKEHARCNDVACIAEMSTDPTCSMVPECVAERCMLGNKK